MRPPPRLSCPNPADAPVDRPAPPPSPSPAIPLAPALMPAPPKGVPGPGVPTRLPAGVPPDWCRRSNRCFRARGMMPAWGEGLCMTKREQGRSTSATPQQGQELHSCCPPLLPYPGHLVLQIPSSLPLPRPPISCAHLCIQTCKLAISGRPKHGVCLPAACLAITHHGTAETIQGSRCDEQGRCIFVLGHGKLQQGR